MSRAECYLQLAFLLGAVLPARGAAPSPAANAAFSTWVQRTFFAAYQPDEGGARWDIPAEANPDHGRVPVNIRSGPLGGAIDLGEARRQYEIEEPFLLVLGLWAPGASPPHLAGVAAPLITPEQWRALWGPVTYADLLRFEDLIQDPARPIEETRRLVLRMKSSPPFSQAGMQLNPIVEPALRQLRCSLRVEDVYRLLAPDLKPVPGGHPALWGVACPGTPPPPPDAR
ncbi:MAG: hypothetical protein ACHQ5A_15075 [Opitutales bacterium]